MRVLVITFSAVVALTLGVGAALVAASETELPGVVRDPAPSAAGLVFDDHAEGDDPVEADLVPGPGELTLAYFGYLSCPDMCPLTMSDLAQARRLVGPELADHTTVAFVTVDPARDEPEDLRRYLEHFFDDGFLALRARDDAALEEAAETLGVRYELEDHDPGERYEVAHSAITYVIDDSGAVVRELPFGATPEDYAQVIEAALTD